MSIALCHYSLYCFGVLVLFAHLFSFVFRTVVFSFTLIPRTSLFQVLGHSSSVGILWKGPSVNSDIGWVLP